MEKRIFKFSLFALLSTFIFAGCKEENTYPTTPEIEFKSLTKYESASQLDSLELVFSFTDGNGDIGTPDIDTFNRDVFVKFFEMKNGVFVEFTNLAAPLEYKIPFLFPRGNNSSLVGDIKINVEYNYTQPNDTIRYELYMRDRARNKSNTITSSTIVTNVE